MPRHARRCRGIIPLVLFPGGYTKFFWPAPTSFGQRQLLLAEKSANFFWPAQPKEVGLAKRSWAGQKKLDQPKEVGTAKRSSRAVALDNSLVAA